MVKYWHKIIMDKVYKHNLVEEKIYKIWEKNGYFTPEINAKKKPYSIILPPPNANAPLHFGHAMYVVEDILIRYHRMKGYSTLWLPGADHAGFETQFVFEKKLEKEGKSRFDFDRRTLYKMILDYVLENKKGMQNQLKRLGFSLDWSRNKFTLDEDIIRIVYKTFKKMFNDGLIYRGERLVNYCTRCGTSFSDLEVNHREQRDPLYFIKYGPLALATVRPETKFGDTAIAVNPKDKRYQKYIGQEIEFQTLLGKKKLRIIADEVIDPKFGTGVVKVTPAHDMKDFEISKRHKLDIIRVIDLEGRLTDVAGPYKGLRIKEARKKVAEDMKKKGLIEKVDNDYVHTIEVCYKCGTTIEPMLIPQWFVKMEPLAKPAVEVIEKKKIKFYPKRHEKSILSFLKNIQDWNISRQIVWGIRIPAWFRSWKPETNLYKMGFHERTEKQVLNGKTKTYRLRDHGLKIGDRFAFKNSQTGKIFGFGTIQDIKETVLNQIQLDDSAHGSKYKNINELIKAFKFHHPNKNINLETRVWIYTYSFGVLKNGKIEEVFIGDEKPKGEGWKQDPDTFDTWFSSSQWPFATLQTTKPGDFNYFYPTSVMETMYDILLFWVARMIMVGIYATGNIPFKDVVLHGMVKDPLGKKMSKSKGNVVDPLEIVDQYGADAVRFALVYGTAFGNDQSLSYPKLDAARKFTNKIWNIARFIEMKREIVNPKWQIPNNLTIKQLNDYAENRVDKEWVEKVNKLTKDITKHIDHYNFHFAAEGLYNFIWHEFADKYIEDVKNRMDDNSYTVLNALYLILLKLLHPFMPFVTEEIFQRFNPQADRKKALAVEEWPKNA
ncbi:MAG: valine--tRNA ligase [Candidatus Pacearchaeota archaeon]